MKANTASKTAQYMALFRALETALPPNKRLFDDPFAKIFLDGTLRQATWISKIPMLGRVIPKIIESKGPGALSSGIARTKFIDDLLLKRIESGTGQVIILGSGFDTRALRLPFLKSIPVIEIDHPDTANLKIEKLKQALGKLPSNVRYLQINFNTQSLEQLASEHQLDFSIPTVIVWEGVSNYISKQAIDNTFEFMSRFGKGSSIIFTYIDKRVLDDPGSFFGTDRILKTLRNSEEEWTFGFNPSELSRYLSAFKLKVLEDKSAVEYRNTYIPDRKELLKGYEFYRVALAVKE